MYNMFLDYCISNTNRKGDSIQLSVMTLIFITLLFNCDEELCGTNTFQERYGQIGAYVQASIVSLKNYMCNVASDSGSCKQWALRLIEKLARSVIKLSSDSSR